LVNNAGITRLKPLLDATVEDWRDVLATNLEAPFFLSQQAIDLMRRTPGGRIVNIASIYGTVGLNNRLSDGLTPGETEGDRGPVRETAYAASKGGLIQMTRDLAVAAARWGITVNVVSPGHVLPPEYPDETGRMVIQASNLAGRDTHVAPTHRGRTREEIAGTLSKQYPLERLGNVEDVAGAVCYLLSDEAAYVTGVNLPVDGGFTAW
jgi:NAD(P)-dependent dehydrogenase (short-subunit alcohol dehydrogenase family)